MAYSDVGTVSVGNPARADWANGVRNNQEDFNTRLINLSSDMTTVQSDITSLEADVTSLDSRIDIIESLHDVYAGSDSSVDTTGSDLVNITLDSNATVITISCMISVDSSSANTEWTGSIGNFTIINDASNTITGSYGPCGGWSASQGVSSVSAGSVLNTKLASVDASNYIEITSYGGPGGNLTITAYSAAGDVVMANCHVIVKR